MARLDSELVARGLARSRNHAATLIREGRVRLDGVPVVKPAAQADPSQRLEVEADAGWVSRAAWKLVGALDEFGVDPAGAVALDAGASTGGFSQVLLERGASRVVAVDVGHGQLSPALRPYLDDGRLVSLEGVNVRSLASGAFETERGGRAFDLVVADLSFISLGLVLPALAAAAAQADFVVLIKPQFEVGRGGVREGVVRDPGLRAQAISDVLWAAHDVGLGVAGLAPSAILGTHGNREYVAHLVPGGGRAPDEWRGRVDELAGA